MNRHSGSRSGRYFSPSLSPRHVSELPPEVIYDEHDGSYSVRGDDYEHDGAPRHAGSHPSGSSAVVYDENDGGYSVRGHDYGYYGVPQDEHEGVRSASETPLLHSPRSGRSDVRQRSHAGPASRNAARAIENNAAHPQAEKSDFSNLLSLIPRIRAIGTRASVGPSGHNENRAPPASSGQSAVSGAGAMELQELLQNRPQLNSNQASRNDSGGDLLDQASKQLSPDAAVQGGNASAQRIDAEFQRAPSVFEQATDAQGPASAYTPSGPSVADPVSDNISEDSAERQAAAEAVARNFIERLPEPRPSTHPRLAPGPFVRPPVAPPVIHSPTATALGRPLATGAPGAPRAPLMNTGARRLKPARSEPSSASARVVDVSAEDDAARVAQAEAQLRANVAMLASIEKKQRARAKEAEKRAKAAEKARRRFEGPGF